MRIRTVKDLRWHVGAHDLDPDAPVVLRTSDGSRTFEISRTFVNDDGGESEMTLVETSRGADCVPDIGKAIWAMPDATLADVVSAVKAMHKDMLHIAGLPLETPND